VGVALRGDLQDFGLAEVFQLIGQQRKTGLLEIQGESAVMRLAFADGSVVWAQPTGTSQYSAFGDMLVRCGLLTHDQLGQLARDAENSARSLPQLLASSGEVSEADLEATLDLLTRETIFQVLRWTRGSFHFSAQPVPHDRPPGKLLGAEEILMDGLRMVDEWRTFAELVPSADAVFRRSAAFDVYRHQARGDARWRLPQAERLLQLVDGRLDARRVIDLSRLGTFEATRILAELRQAGVIELVDAQRARRLRSKQKRTRPVIHQARWWLAAAFPIALLSLLVSISFDAFQRLPSIPLTGSRVEAGLPIPHAPLEEARQAFEKRRVRNALEAHRHLSGSWPESLTELDPSGVLNRGSLTPSSAEPYYYVRRENGFLLLAPDR
jgi:hypothetical protein